MTAFRLLLLLIVSSLIAGCASTGTRYSTSVNAISGDSKYSSPGVSCIVLPGKENTRIDDLEFREYSVLASKALQENGFIVTDDPKKADIAVFLDYAISTPKQETTTDVIPTFGQTGYSSANTYGNYNPYSGSYQGTTYYTPSYGVTGYTPVTVTHTYYTRVIIFDAREIIKNDGDAKLGKQAWKVITTSHGTSGDLRRVFPYLVVASKNHLGKNTGKAIEIEVSEKDPAVIAFTGLQPEK